MTKPVAVLMQKQMTRQEFLATMGFGLASIMGFSSFLHLLTGKRFDVHRGVSNSAPPAGYGSSAYGGGRS